MSALRATIERLLAPGVRAARALPASNRRSLRARGETAWFENTKDHAG